MKKVIEANSKWVNDVWEKVDLKLQKVCIRSREKLPYTSIDGVHDNKAETKIYTWTNGFWGGLMWLMYVGTHNEEYKKTAIRAEQLLDKALENYKKLHHDVGFMWDITSVARYRITGEKDACNKGLYLASTLFSRFQIKGGFIRAWNKWNEPDDNKTKTIIDCLLNIPLLYWASSEVEDDRFAKVAMQQADMSIRDHIRSDGSINHVVEHDENTGLPVKVYAGQGYSPDSSWSRGVSWAIYGMMLSYIYTKQQRYMDAAILAADHFISHCKKTGYLPVADFLAPQEPVYYDSTAGACAACGLIEIAKHLDGERSKYYMEEALKLLKAIDANFCNYSDDEDALVLMGTERYPHDERGFAGVHIPIIYGDFFFVEALLKLKGSDFLIW